MKENDMGKTAKGDIIRKLWLFYVNGSFFSNVSTPVLISMATLNYHKLRAQRTPPIYWHKVLEVRRKHSVAGFLP